MPAKAYILIETTPGRTGQAVQTLRGRPGVVAADAVADTYDIIAVVEAKDGDELDLIVRNQIQGLEGIARTLICRTVAS